MSLLLLRSIVVAASVWFGGAALAEDVVIDGVPIPIDAKIAPVAQDVSEDQRRFLGAWAGTWAGDHRHVVIVEEVRANGDANIIYAIADHASAQTQAIWRRHVAKIADQRLTVTDPTFSATYEFAPSGALRAVFRSGETRNNGMLWRVDLSTLMAARASVAWTPLKREFLHTSLLEDGKPVRLEVVLFRPAGSGPFPLFVFNHGSTGSGKDTKVFTETRWSFAVAALLAEKGWLVAFPQRRGRGKSDGLYDEGFEPDRTHGYTCDPARSLAGADRALDDIEAAIAVLKQRPDVAPTLVLIGGVSRGGILAVAYAGRHPEQIAGVINFVGGWVGEGCKTAPEINGELFRRGAKFRRPTLWLYGQRDLYYSMAHSRSNFDEFLRSGGQGTFHEFEVPGPNGHALNAYPELWAAQVDAFLSALK